MNPHDQRGNTARPALRRGSVLGRVFFAWVIYGAVMFAGGYMSAEYRLRVQPPAPATSAPSSNMQTKPPANKKQVKTFIQRYHAQGEGWIK